MSRLRLSIACWNDDRTRALLEGRVPVDGAIPVFPSRFFRHSCIL